MRVGDARTNRLLVGNVLEVRPPEIGVVLVLVPPGVEPCVRIAVVDAEPIVRRLSVPLDDEFRFLWACRGLEPLWIERRRQSLRFDGVRDVLDSRDLGNPVEDVTFELLIEVRVWIAARMLDTHLSAFGVDASTTWREEVPLSDCELDDLDASLEMLPVTGDFATPFHGRIVELAVGDRGPKLVR